MIRFLILTDLHGTNKIGSNPAIRLFGKGAEVAAGKYAADYRDRILHPSQNNSWTHFTIWNGPLDNIPSKFENVNPIPESVS